MRGNIRTLVAAVIITTTLVIGNSSLVVEVNSNLAEENFKDPILGIPEQNLENTNIQPMSSISSQAIALAWGDEDTDPANATALAYNEFGSGRVVITNGVNFLDNRYRDAGDNKQLALNMFDWLVLSGKKVMWLEKKIHLSYSISGWFSDLADDLANKGFNVNSYDGTLSDTVLANYDILVVQYGGNAGNPFTTSEIDAIENYVDSGHSLFLGGENGQCSTDYMSLIGSRFGVTFNKDLVEDPTNNDGRLIDVIFHQFASHPITQGINEYSVRAACSLAGPVIDPRIPPVADAGPDQTVNVGEIVQFDGGGSYDPEGDFEFGTNVKVSDYNVPHVRQCFPKIAVDSNNIIHVVWEDERNYNSYSMDIYYARSIDYGQSFLPNTRVNDGTTHAAQATPVISTNQNNDLFIAWADDRDHVSGSHPRGVFFTKSTDSGQTFEPYVKVNDFPGAVPCKEASIDISSHGTDDVYLVWQDTRNSGTTGSDIYFSKSTNGGTSFESNVNVSDAYAILVEGTPTIDVDGEGNIYTAWMDSRNSWNYDIYFSKSTDEGNTFTNNGMLNDDAGDFMQWHPSIAVDDEGNINTVWHDYRNPGNSDIYYSRSNDKGNSFESNIRVNEDPASSGQTYPDIDVNSFGDVYVVWRDSRNGYPDVYFSWSTDGGKTFRKNVKVNDVDPGAYAFMRPSIAVDNLGNPHVVWRDPRDENYGDIYYAKGLHTLTYDWDFGDGSLHEGSMRPTHVYSNPGTYLVTLNVTNLNGITDSDTCTITVLAASQPPVADAGSDQTAPEGYEVQFDGSESYQHNGIIESYEWDFDSSVDSNGDGNYTNDAEATEVAPTHIFGDNGVYNVTLTVKSPGGEGEVVEVDQDVIFCVDTSGSMTQQSIDIIKEGLNEYVDEMEYADRGAVVVFSTGAYLINMLTSNYTQLREDIGNIPGPGGWTYMGSALNTSVEELRLNGNLGHTRVIILLTDGEPMGPDPYDVIDQVNNAKSNNITIFTIGLGPHVYHQFLINIANTTQGEYYYAPDASYISTIYAEIAEIVEYPGGPPLMDTDTMQVTVNNVQPGSTFPIITGYGEEGSRIYGLIADAIDPGSDDLIFEWDYGDGTSETKIYYNDGMNPEPIYNPVTNEIKSPWGQFPFSASDESKHIYGDNGVYPLSITISDDDGGALVFGSSNSTVENVPPVLSVNIPTVINEGEDFFVYAEAIDNGSDDLTFIWDWGDGTSPVVRTFYNNFPTNTPDPYPSPLGIYPFSVSYTQNHIYGDNGVFTVRVTIFDDDNGTTTYQTDITVNNIAPEVDPLPNIIISESETATLSGHATDPGSDDLTFSWSWEYAPWGDKTTIYFNDGMGPDPYPSPSINPRDITEGASCQFGDNGVFEVTLTVTDDDGTSTIVMMNVTVNNLEPEVEALPNVIIDEGETVTLSGHATDLGSDDLTVSWTWEYAPWGDKSTNYFNDGMGPDPYPSPSINPRDITEGASCQFGDNGVFKVTLTVTDDDGASTTVMSNVTVNNIKPILTITSVTMDVEIGLRVAGRKYNKVGMTLFEEGSQMGHVSIERLPGSPDEQMAWIPATLDMTKTFSAQVTYTPKDPPDLGANPVWIYIKFPNGSIQKIHHTFNVQQSKERDSNHWNHIEPWDVDLNLHLIGCGFEVNYLVTDPGSDDEILTFTYGSQNVVVTHLNNPPTPDPYPSPEINPRDLHETTYLIYDGSGILSLKIEDDDGGSEVKIIHLA
jgi:PKD repeat protein